jgi:hypothetical protein
MVRTEAFDLFRSQSAAVIANKRIDEGDVYAH